MDNNKNIYYYEDRSDIPPGYYGGKRSAPSFTTVLFIVIGLIILCASSAYVGVVIAQRTSKTRNIVVYEQADNHPSQLLNNGEMKTVAGVAEAVKDSVVEIVTEKVYFENIFRQYVTSGAGSGIVWSSDGYIVTNYHVVKNTQNIRVTLSCGEVFQAEMKYADDRTDVAVLKIDAEGLMPVIVGKSSDLIVGQEVVAVGNPLGSLGGSVTNGIISALDREITVGDEDMVLMQTNAAVNPGNSGGGLFNMYGELIGIVNAKSGGSGIEGIGFAIPSDTAKTVVEDLLELGYVRGRVNEDMLSLDEFTSGGIIKHTVLRVASVNTNTPIPIRVNDYILSVNGTAVKKKSEWDSILKKCNVGDTVVICYQRGSTVLECSVTLEERTKPKNL